MSEKRFSTMFKFSFRGKRDKDKKFVSIAFINTCGGFYLFDGEREKAFDPG